MGEEGDWPRARAPSSSLFAIAEEAEAGVAKLIDEAMMGRALELARVPAFTSPNPRVGAVLARDGVMVAEAYHAGAGTPHAEAEVVSHHDAAGADLYVTLEPCIHTGRTPPCVPAIVSAGIRRVIVAISDPDQRVDGRGIAALRAAGVEVVTNVLEPAARELNHAYLHQRTHGRTQFTLKLALSLDGKIAAPDGTSKWITGSWARALVHARRVEADAVVVGSGTVLADDPALTVRDAAGQVTGRPVRVVLDSRGRVAGRARVFQGAPETPVIVVTTENAMHDRQTEWKEAGAEVMVVSSDADGEHLDLHAVRDDFARRRWLEAYFEGGATVATALLRQGLVDRLEIHSGTKMIGGAGLGLGSLGVGTIAEASRWSLVSVRSDQEVVAVYEPVRS